MIVEFVRTLGGAHVWCLEIIAFLVAVIFISDVLQNTTLLKFIGYACRLWVILGLVHVWVLSTGPSILHVFVWMRAEVLGNV